MGDWIKLCDVTEVAEGEAKAFTVGGKRLCTVFDGERVFALDDLCNHGQAYLSDGYCDIEDGVVECPLHGGLFNYRDGSPQGDPVDKPNRSYATRIENDQVMVEL